ncbi:MAG: hypothetical protein FWB96_00850 [Defluviitaleaceae bacterium]|nr:hypothetical protein [Defluviitaleaceae bacterium]MCL2262756.1 hypothetical protein [Defluviitaleaceae bacterium]
MTELAVRTALAALLPETIPTPAVTQEMFLQFAEVIIANQLWLIGLNAFGLGVSIVTIFAILWGRK